MTLSADLALPLPDADIHCLPSLWPEPDDRVLLRRLIEEVPWRSEEVRVRGRRHVQPRLIAWFGDPDARYSYSSLSLEPLPWTPLLSEIRATVERVSETTFNSVLLNYYRHERDSMGLHSDDEPELGRNPVIASVSLGEERTFILKHKTRKDLKAFRLPLASGSLLLMKGATQHHWRHGIGKEARPRGPRVNLTFRRIVRSSGVRDPFAPAR